MGKQRNEQKIKFFANTWTGGSWAAPRFHNTSNTTWDIFVFLEELTDQRGLAAAVSTNTITMSTTQSAEEIKKEQIAVLGLEFGSLYNLLYNEIIWLHYKWTEFEELYGIEESRIKIMNNTAPFFFFMIQGVFWENILLGIARITDQQVTGGKKNMTILAIPELINDQELKKSVEIKIKTILEKTKFCRDRRNRKIAHYDYYLSINSIAKPLEKASKILVKEALNEILELINLLHGFYFKSTLMLDLIKSHKGALSLLYTLDDGLKERENYFNRSGVWGSGDINIDPNEIK